MSTEDSPSKFGRLKRPKGALRLPRSMREQLSTGLGHIVDIDNLSEELKGCKMLLAIGDMVSLTLLDNGYAPDLIVYDLKTERRTYTPLAEKLDLYEGIDVRVDNPAGLITAELVDELSEALKRDIPTKLMVEGEEDLAALACAAMAPLDSCLMYGIPGKGMAIMRIDTEIAGLATKFIEEMEELD
ncbi:MAG: DUF359 domain-containing protein [Euryarchaeota archaeon]|nr:DUF359 domain-containing protein [Euryarchaeota archaeon]